MNKPTTVMELLRARVLYNTYLKLDNRVLMWVGMDGCWWVYQFNDVTVDVITLYRGNDESAAVAALIGIDS